MPTGQFLTKWNALSSRLGCPVAGQESGLYAYQTYLGGFMFDDLRNPNAKVVSAFFSDGHYVSYPDSFQDGQNEDSCPSVPSGAGLIRPRRGFSRVWCEHPDVRSRLPGATDQEQLVTLSIQRFQRGVIWVNSPAGVIALMTDGTWR